MTRCEDAPTIGSGRLHQCSGAVESSNGWPCYRAKSGVRRSQIIDAARQLRESAAALVSDLPSDGDLDTRLLVSGVQSHRIGVGYGVDESYIRRAPVDLSVGRILARGTR